MFYVCLNSVPITHGLDEDKNKEAWKMLFQKLMMEFLDVSQPKEAASLELSLVSLLAGIFTQVHKMYTSSPLN